MQYIPYCHGTQLQMVQQDMQRITYCHGTQLQMVNQDMQYIPYCHSTQLQMVKQYMQCIPYCHGTQLQMVKEDMQYIPYCMGYTVYLLSPFAAEYHDYLPVFMHKILLSFHHILSASHNDGCIWCLYLHSSALLHWYWDYWHNHKDWDRGMDK